MFRTSPIREGNRLLVLLTVLFLSTSAAQAQFACLSLGTGAGNPGVSTGNRNTALGEFSLASNTTGSDNTSVGAFACNANTNGDSNTAVGSFALVSNTTGDVNTAIGSGAMPSNTTGRRGRSGARCRLGQHRPRLLRRQERHQRQQQHSHRPFRARE